MLKKIITNDGSTSFFNEEIQDSYHSASGAEEEAKKKYAELIKKFQSSKDEIVVYDFCFGLGYNSAALIDEVKNKKIRIYCFENDKEILSQIPLIKTNFKSFSLIKEFINKFLMYKNEEIINSMVELRMVFGDAKKLIKKKREFADYVFFDPFSPSKVPHMWDEEIFKALYDSMNKESFLFTYSCSKKVRENMKKAGFEVTDGPIIGRKSPSTIAKKPI